MKINSLKKIYKPIKKHPIFKRVLLSVFGNGISSSFNFVVNLIVVRVLTASEFGIFQYLITVIRGILRIIDFSSVELLLFSKKRNFSKEKLLSTFYSIQIIKLFIMMPLSYIAYNYNLFQIPFIFIFLTIIYIDIRYYVIYGIVHIKEVFTGTKSAQLIHTTYSLFITVIICLLYFIIDFNLYNIILSFFFISIFYIIIILFTNKDLIIVPKLDVKVLKSFLSQSLFLEIQIVIGVLLKILQDTLIIFTTGNISYALYAISKIFGSIIIVISKAMVRPLNPFFWRINIDSKKETSVIYVSVFIYACALTFSILFVQHVETFIVYINPEYIGVSEILFWSVLLGAASSSNQLVVALLSGKMLIKFVSITSSLYLIINTGLLLIIYYYFMSPSFISDVLKLNVFLITIYTLILLILNYYKLYFTDNE